MIPGSSSVEQNQKAPKDGDQYSSSANVGHAWKNVKKRKDKEKEEYEERQESSSSSKKPRLVWSAELHQKFVSAINQLGIDAGPRRILELMKVPGLSREKVASHLQKYRLRHRRLNGSQHMGSLYGSFMGSPEVGDRSLSTVNEFGLQTMASSSQLPGRTFATLPAAIAGRSNDVFSFENQKMQYGQSQVLVPMAGEGQSEHHPLAAILQEGYTEKYGVDETLDAHSNSMSNTYPRCADHVSLTNGYYDGFGSGVDGFMLQGNNLEEDFNTAYNEAFVPVQEMAEQHEPHKDSIRDELGSLKLGQEAQARKIDELLESQASYEGNLKKIVAQEVGNIVAQEIAKANYQLLEYLRKPP